MPASRNPYHRDDGSRVVRPSVVAILDILGFAAMAREAQRSGTEDAFLSSLYSALEQGRMHRLEYDKWIESEESVSRLMPKDNYALKAFTDNIVMGWPIRSDGETELGSAFDALVDRL
jgi:hypothetical protein